MVKELTEKCGEKINEHISYDGTINLYEIMHTLTESVYTKKCNSKVVGSFVQSRCEMVKVLVVATFHSSC